ncbi:MAG: DinB family protein [Rhodothermales bacterium]|nr:DinB family protein [Rhodothermales bacterium]
MLYSRPSRDECPEYYFAYIDKVPDGDILDLLSTQVDNTASYLASLPPELGTYRYADGKWTVSEVLGHMVDCERVFAFRGLHIARGDKTPIPGFEQDDWVASTDFNRRSIKSLADELHVLRASTVMLFKNLTAEEIERTGTASGYPFSVRTIPYIIAGHEIHHLGVLKDRYV